MKIIIVSGTWDENGGTPSKVAIDIVKGLSAYTSVAHINGGDYNQLKEILESSILMKNSDAIIWAPNVANNLPKIRNVKEYYPKKILVTTKNTIRRKISIQTIIAHGLAQKSNLMVPISLHSDRSTFLASIIDPLGNMWFKPSDNFVQLGKELYKHISRLLKVTRQPSIQGSTDNISFTATKESDHFIEVVKKCGDIFHELLMPDSKTKRFLGNSSFRCSKGFPSMRTHDGIFVSRRNVDKRNINNTSFVRALLAVDKTVYYYGQNKPSVDTPIQLRLYEELPEINYMIHGHVYVKDAFYTQKMIPCGGIEEVAEIITALKKNNVSLNSLTAFAINLIGHGCIIFGQTPTDLEYFKYSARNIPEHMYNI